MHTPDALYDALLRAGASETLAHALVKAQLAADVEHRAELLQLRRELHWTIGFLVLLMLVLGLVF